MKKLKKVILASILLLSSAFIACEDSTTDTTTFIDNQAKFQYSIEQESENTINFEIPAEVKINDQIKLNIYPKKGYEISKLKINAQEIDYQKTKIFKLKKEKTIIAVEFKKCIYSIKIVELNHGQIIIKVNNRKLTKNNFQAKYEDNIELEIIPDNGYKLAENSLFINTNPCQKNNFSMPAEDIKIAATFIIKESTGGDEPAPEITYPLTVRTTSNGKINLSHDFAQAGELITITLSEVRTGFALKENSLKFNEQIIINKQFVMPAKPVEITGEFKDARKVEEKYNPLDFDNGTYRIPYTIGNTDGADKIRSKTENYIDVTVSGLQAKITFHYKDSSKIIFFCKKNSNWQEVNGSKDYTFTIDRADLAKDIWLKNKFDFFPMSWIKPDGSAWTIRPQLDQSILKSL